MDPAPRAESAARVAFAVLLVLGLASLPSWRGVGEQPGIDFYQYWGLAKAQRDSGYALGSPYRAPAGYQHRLVRIAAASDDVQMQSLAATKQWLDVTGTPFGYSLMGSLPAPYSLALLLWRVVQVLAFSLAVLALARPLASGATAALLALATALAFDPLLLDVRVGNLSSVQLLGIVIAATLLQHRSKGPVRTVLVPALLVLLTLMKPIVAGAAAMLALNLLSQGSLRERAAAIATATVVTGIFCALPALLFGSVGIWSDWWQEVFRSDARLAYGAILGNYSSVALLADLTGQSIASAVLMVGAAVAASLVVAALPARSARAALGEGIALLRDPFGAAALGVLALLAASPLVWSHYQVLAVIPALWLCGSPAGERRWPRWLGWATLVVVADPLRRLLMLWGGLPLPIVDFAHAFSWLPLWIGVLGVYRARLL